MAVIGTILTGATAGKKIAGGIKTLFGGGSNFAQQDRNRKRQALSQVGFNWRKTSGVPRGEEWNIDNWGSRALDNLARLYDEYPEIAVDLHNNRKLSDSIASSFTTLQQLALAEEEKRKPKSNFGGIGFTQAGGGMSDGVKALLTAAAIGGGLFFFLND